jgi:TonB family protein
MEGSPEISKSKRLKNFNRCKFLNLVATLILAAPSMQAAASVWASAPKPNFPQAALSKGSEGYVIVRAYVDATGAVTRVTIAKSSGESMLDDAARMAVLKWRMRADAIKPEYHTSGYQVRFDFQQDSPVALKYRDRTAYFSTYRSAQIWRYVSAPEYPIHEAGMRAKGTTMVGITVGPDGEVASAEVVKTSGYPNLDNSALAAVRRWRAHKQYAGRHLVVPVEFAPGALRRR